MNGLSSPRARRLVSTLALSLTPLSLLPDQYADTPLAKIGITEHAADALGDVVFVELAEEGREVSAGEPVGAVESVKSASDVLSPVAGRVTQGNKVLEDNAKLINQSAEKDAWIAEIEVSDPAELEGLLDEAAYKEVVAAE